MQQAIVDEFNASQDAIELVLKIVDNAQAYAVLNIQIAAGNDASMEEFDNTQIVQWVLGSATPICAVVTRCLALAIWLTPMVMRLFPKTGVRLKTGITMPCMGPRRFIPSALMQAATCWQGATGSAAATSRWDFFGPLIYLAGNRPANPITVGLTKFNGLYNNEPQLILAAAIISMLIPLTIFFLAQRVFIQGIVITGGDK